MAPRPGPWWRANQVVAPRTFAGVDKLHFIALWNGAVGDGRGGAAHMVDEVKRLTGQVYRLDTRELFAEHLGG